MTEQINAGLQEQSNEVYNEFDNGRKKKRIASVIGLIVFSLFILMIAYIFTVPNKQKETLKKVVSNGETLIFHPQNTPTPTPLPFAELTIPFLREKKYESRIGEMEEIYQGGTYTAYLTNYTSDSLKINSLLTRPNGDMPEGGWPAIVFIHGYIPPSLYETNGQAYSSYVDYLANNGFVVFKIDLRGHGESEGEVGGGYFGADYVTDALNAVSALQSSGFVNPKKIGMWGHSMAGNIILRSFAVKPDIPAVVIWSGAVYSYTDLLKYMINDQSYRPPSNTSVQRSRRQKLFENVGSPSAQSVFWQKMAPTSFLNELKGAIQLHHALDDDVVNIGYSRDLIELLDKTKIQHEFYSYPDGGHNITGASFNLAMQRTVEFFQKNLK